MVRDKKAITVCVDRETDERIYDLRGKEEFRYCSKSDIVRALIRLGLKEKEDDRGPEKGGTPVPIRWTAEELAEMAEAEIDDAPVTDEEIAEIQRRYYEANREQIADYKRRYREANRDQIAEIQRRYYEANREQIADYKRRYREANREQIAEIQRRY